MAIAGLILTGTAIVVSLALFVANRQAAGPGSRLPPFDLNKTLARLQEIVGQIDVALWYDGFWRGCLTTATVLIVVYLVATRRK
jgi:hypothetical protein